MSKLRTESKILIFVEVQSAQRWTELKSATRFLSSRTYSREEMGPAREEKSGKCVASEREYSSSDPQDVAQLQSTEKPASQRGLDTQLMFRSRSKCWFLCAVGQVNAGLPAFSALCRLKVLQAHGSTKHSARRAAATSRCQASTCLYLFGRTLASRPNKAKQRLSLSFLMSFLQCRLNSRISSSVFILVHLVPCYVASICLFCLTPTCPAGSELRKASFS